MEKNSTFSFPTSGDIGFPMTNDYLFRALLQKNNRVLKGLIAALLHMDEKEIASADIQNPIVLGESIDDKTFILDVKVLLNSKKIIDLEMQVINRHDWVERSLSYLCRNFDDLEKGENYTDVTAVHQIGILDFTLFDEYPEFYATYELLNVRNYHHYSSKLRLSVVDLTRIDLATEEDRSYRIDYWAQLFKATTWEDLTMLAQKDEIIKDAAETVYEISQERLIRDKIRAREDYYRTQRDMEIYYGRIQSNYDEAKKELEETKTELAEKKTELTEVNTELAEVNTELQKTQSENSELKKRLAELEAQLAKK